MATDGFKFNFQHDAVAPSDVSEAQPEVHQEQAVELDLDMTRVRASGYSARQAPADANVVRRTYMM
jgi:hypothetical protein